MPKGRNKTVILFRSFLYTFTGHMYAYSLDGLGSLRFFLLVCMFLNNNIQNEYRNRKGKTL